MAREALGTATAHHLTYSRDRVHPEEAMVARRANGLQCSTKHSPELQECLVLLRRKVHLVAKKTVLIIETSLYRIRASSLDNFTWMFPVSGAHDWRAACGSDWCAHGISDVFAPAGVRNFWSDLAACPYSQFNSGKLRYANGNEK